jgi:hypothetical protein
VASAPIAIATPRADFATDGQRRRGLKVLPLALVDGLELRVDMVGLKSMWRWQLLDCLYVFSGLLGQGEIIWLNDGCPILDYLLSACRQPVVIQMTDQQFQSLIWVLLDSRTYFLPDDCKAASLKVAPGQSPGRNEQA